jgi:hypothetical protein
MEVATDVAAELCPHCLQKVIICYHLPEAESGYAPNGRRISVAS